MVDVSSGIEDAPGQKSLAKIAEFLEVVGEVWWVALLLAALLVAAKPFVFATLLKRQGEASDVAWEVGYRLGQGSEFSLLLSYIAISNALVSAQAALIIQFATVLTLVVSSYFVIFRYPSPIAPNARLRRD